MRINCVFAIGAMVVVGGCDRDEPAPSEPQPPKEAKAPHCFFKDEEAKDWKLVRKGDQLVVRGRAYRSDSRYKTVFLDPLVEGTVAVFRPTIAINDTGYASEDDWWDMEKTIPAGTIETVEVRCGKKLLASLPVDKGTR